MSLPLRKAGPLPEGWEQLRAILDSAEPRIRRAFLRAIRQTQVSVDLAALESALQRRDWAAVERAIPWDTVALGVLRDEFVGELGRTVLEAGKVEARVIAEPGTAAISIPDTYRTDFLASHGARLVVEIDDEYRQVLRETVTRGFRQGMTPKQLADHIRGSGLGLFSRLQGAVDNYRSALAEQGRDQGFVSRQTEAYHRRMLQYRASNIARTEGAFAVSAGQDAAWRTSIDAGRINIAAAQIAWVTVPDDLANHPESCLAMNGRTVPIRVPLPSAAELAQNPDRALNQPWIHPETGREIHKPPMHPSCRCTRRLLARGPGRASLSATVRELSGARR